MEGIRKITLQFKTEGYSNGRWIMNLSDGTITINPLEQDEFLTTSTELARKVGDSMGMAVSRKDLPDIIKAAATRLGAS